MGPTAHCEQAPSSEPPGALDPKEWRSFRVMSKEPVTKNTQQLRCVGTFWGSARCTVARLQPESSLVSGLLMAQPWLLCCADWLHCADARDRQALRRPAVGCATDAFAVSQVCAAGAGAGVRPARRIVPAHKVRVRRRRRTAVHRERSLCLQAELLCNAQLEAMKHMLGWLSMALLQHRARVRALRRAPIGSENPDGSRKFVIRPYTPTSPPDARGYLDLVSAHASAVHSAWWSAIQGCQCPEGSRRLVCASAVAACCLRRHACGRCAPAARPRATGCGGVRRAAARAQVVKGYEQGKLSKHIVGLEVGDTLEFKGPVSKLEYAPNMKKALGMVPPRTGSH